MHRQALLDIQKAVLLPEAIDTETVFQHTKELEALEEQTEPSPEPMVWDIANNKEIIHAPDRSSGKRKQKVEIVYNGVGILNIPELTDEMLRKNRQTA